MATAGTERIERRRESALWILDFHRHLGLGFYEARSCCLFVENVVIKVPSSGTLPWTILFVYEMNTFF